jgi:dTDP-glucose 4,6-dehydratase
MRTLLVTGAAGFIGSNFVRMLCNRGEDVKIVALDKLTYAGNLGNLKDLLEQHGPDAAKHKSVATNPTTGQRIEVPGRHTLTFVKGDICDKGFIEQVWSDHGVTEVVHFAAESHVDRSILDSGPFVQTNVVGTQVLLDVAKARKVDKYLQVSTDEVYGTLPEDQPEVKFTEQTPLEPNSPYSASKAAADCLVRSYYHTFHMPVLTTRCSNNYGPYHFPEKMIPLFVTNLMEGKKVPLYGDGMNVRDWLYVEDHCDGIWTVLNGGKFGEVYNIGGHNEIPNRKITEIILNEMGKNWDESVTYVKDRPGHDRRYAIDAGRMQRELGWKPKYKFEEAIKHTIQWYKDNQPWWRAIKSGDYLKYYETQYVNR